MARLFSARTLIFGGLAAGAAYALRNNSTVKGLLGGGSSEAGGSGSYSAPASAPVGAPAVERDEPMPAPSVSNADVAGPPSNTATHVPAPEPLVHAPEGGIDEEAEVAAAAAEAANIGGIPEEYPSEDDPSRPIDEALRPLEEAGEGYSEGQELAEADLIDNAEVAGGDPIDGELAINDAIEAQDDPFAGEVAEGAPGGITEPLPDEEPEPTLQMPLADAPPPSGAPADMPPPEDAPEAAAITPSGTAMPEEATPAAEKSSAVWRIEDQPTAEQPAVEDDPDRQDG